MSAATPRSLPPIPPEKGSFPLDHFGDCKPLADQYKLCLFDYDNDNGPCREIAKKYLICRMDHGLMARETLTDLGFKEEKGASSS